MSTDIITVNQNLLNSYWQSIIPDDKASLADDVKYQFIECFKELAGGQKRDTDLYLKANAWTLEIKKIVFDELKCHVAASALLWHFELTELPVFVLSTIFSILFNAKRTTVDGRDEDIYLNLVASEGKDYQEVAEWYNVLPEELRSTINMGDFTDLLDKLDYAGLARTKGGKYLVVEKGLSRLRIHISKE